MRQIIKSHFLKRITPLFEGGPQKFWQLRHHEGIRWRKKTEYKRIIALIEALEYQQVHKDLTAEKLAALPLNNLPRPETLIKNQSDREAVKKLEE